MKTIKHTFVTLAIIGLSFFSSKAFGQVLVFANGYTNPGPSICDGEKFQIFSIGVSNNTDTMIEFKEFPVSFKNAGIMDSVFLLDKHKNVITGMNASQYSQLKFGAVIDKYQSTDFYIVIKPKIGKIGSFEIEVTNYLYLNLSNSNLITYPYSLTATTGQVLDCSPKIKVTVYDNNRRDSKYCDNEKPGAYGNTQNYWGDIKYQKWSVNGKEVWMKKGLNNGIYLPGDLMKLEYPKTKVLLEVVDYMGRTGRDSITIDVIKSPQINLITSSESFCSGKKIPVSVDTVGLISWSINWGKQVGVNNNFHISEEGTYYFQGFARSGCFAETSSYFYELPAQEKLKISYKDTVLWVNQKADTLQWFVDDIPINFQQSVINSKENGFYHVVSTNSSGCKSISDKILFCYEPLEADLPTPDLAVSNCKLFANSNLNQPVLWEWSSSKNTTVYNTNESEFNTPKGQTWWKVRFLHNGQYSPYSNAVFMDCNTAGIKVEPNSGLKIYPNPAIDQFNIESSQHGEAQLIDMQGKVIRTMKIGVGSNSFTRDGIAGGVYILHTDYGSTRIVFTN